MPVARSAELSVPPADALVSVIVPAHNAANTLDAALRSARSQDYSPIEIIVVDDGSTDATQSIAGRHAREDSRVRVFTQARGGPGSARNLGIAEAKAELIAPLDADDLWHSTKIARQVEALRAGGECVGLVYTWFASIDTDGRVLSTGHRPVHFGDVLRACCRRNLIGNGSGALMRKSAILECGGYDETLEGCEDLKLYTAIAERYHYALVPEHLTGYRQTDCNLTSDVAMIQRSAEIVVAELGSRHPQFAAELHAMKCDLYHWLLRRGLLAGRPTSVLRIARELWRLDPRFGLKSLLSLPLDLRLRWDRSRRRLVLGPRCQHGELTALPYFLVDQTIT